MAEEFYVNNENLKDQRGIEIYPNPASTECFIHLGNKKEFFVITISDLAGRSYYRKEVSGEKTVRISLSDQMMPNGIYIVQVNNNGKVVSEKLVIR